MSPERRFKGRNGKGRLHPRPKLKPRPCRTLAYCGQKMVLTMGSTLKLSFSPTIGGEQPEQVIEVGVKIPDRSGFYIRIDLDETPSQSLYVGFWLWTPESQERAEFV